jgi:hypothetical protein
MVTVRYTCPRCGSVVELDRDAYLADRSVTPEPLEGWEYVPAYESGEFETADGIELVCGASETRGEGCGRPFYLSFVRFESGEEVEPRAGLADPPRFEFLD